MQPFVDHDLYIKYLCRLIKRVVEVNETKDFT